MCGIAGFLSVDAGTGTEAERSSILRRMGHAIAHRGPDDDGVWQDTEAGIGFVHRRLSIVDLSPAGHQPMASSGGRYVIVFNGEIYNHRRLRAEIEAAAGERPWRGHSDTETLLGGIELWGLEAMLGRCVGMFAFALWDRQERSLTLCRDRMGEKPLYYGWQGRAFLFGSELKALRAHDAFAASIDRDAIALLMRLNYIPAPHSVYRGIAKLPPGCLLTVSARHRDAKPHAYWTARGAIADGRAHPFEGTADEAVDSLETLLKEAVAQQMEADVPLGAFLSGGVDSSTIVALMQAQSRRPVKTFAIGFDEEAYNEAHFAEAVARHLGTEHTSMYVSPQDALDVIPLLPAMYDEPFADSSQIPTHLVSRLARTHVTVSLSGDAGDELFCGYTRYLLGDRLWRRISRLPPVVRRGLAGMITSLSPAALDRVMGAVENLLPRRLRLAPWGDKLHKGARVLASPDSSELYRGLVSHWDDPAALVLGSTEPPTPLTDGSMDITGLNDVERMMAIDTVSYLPDDVLCKVDRAAMSVSLESRVPLLDHRVVEFAWRLPQSMKLRDGVSKWVLRQVLYRHVPQSLIDRPKTGFGVPIGEWLRGPLRVWAEDLLDESRLRQDGLFDVAMVRRRWSEHLGGRRNWQYHLWDVLAVQSWLAAQRGVQRS